MPTDPKFELVEEAKKWLLNGHVVSEPYVHVSIDTAAEWLASFASSRIAELAGILRFERDGDEYWIPAEQAPLGPFTFMEAVKEFMEFNDRMDKKDRDELAASQKRVEELDRAAREAFNIIEQGRLIGDGSISLKPLEAKRLRKLLLATEKKA